MKTTPVSRLMTEPLVELRTWHTMQRAARLLLDHEIGGAPVLDHEDRPVGVLTKTDVLRYERQYAGPAAADLKRIARDPAVVPSDREREEDYVARWMTRGVVTIEPDADAAQAASLMARRHLHRLFVGDGKRLLGVITAFDLLRAVGSGHYSSGGTKWRRNRSGSATIRSGRAPGSRKARRGRAATAR